MRFSLEITMRWPRRSRKARADWGVTLDTIARRAGLGFLPVQEERYDFVVPKLRANRPGVVAFTRLLKEPVTRDALAHLGMTFSMFSQ